MNAIQSTTSKRSAKQDRELQVLMGLVDYFLKTGKPVGSHTLKETGFEHLSSATIRNYFAKLEEEGYLSQQHSSGGRVPTERAFRLYANTHLENKSIDPAHETLLKDLRESESREVASYLQYAAEKLSSLTNMAVFLSAPRFDQDFIVGIKLLSVDHERCLCVIMTDFGAIKTEIVYLDQKLTIHSIKHIEAYFHWRLTGQDKPEGLPKEEEERAQKIYNELIVRYLVSYSNFVDAELYRTGFSKLLHYPDFYDTRVLAESLALFENVHNMRLLVRECCKHNCLKFWVGDDLSVYSAAAPNCAVIAIPYYINSNLVGAVGLLGPIRMPYNELFSILRCFSSNISTTLTKNLYKFKITFRQPHSDTKALELSEQRLILL